MDNLWRVGGVVTQRIANPCTPVRFRYSPPDILHSKVYIIIPVRNRLAKAVSKQNSAQLIEKLVTTKIKTLVKYV